MPPLPVRYAAHVSLLCRILCCFKLEVVKVALVRAVSFVCTPLEEESMQWTEKPSQEGTLKHGLGQHTGQ